MKEKIYSLLKLLLCFIFFFCIGDIFSYVLGIFGIDVTKFSNKILVIYQFIMSFIIFIVLFFTYKKTIKKDYESFRKEKNKNITYIIKMFVIFMIVKYLVSFISVLIMTLLNFDTSSMTSVNQNLIESYVKASPILMLISTAIFAPFYEEVLFRLGFKKVFKNKYIFVILSGMIFGLMHVFPLEDGIPLMLGIMQSITYVTMGIFLSYVYYKMDNIFISIGIHFLNNLLSVLAMINML